ncbi:hypothetical protein CVIRNUC_002541 [Coccomyxa viridis]|uniref:Roadblock/LAMTOR2 domain-containing protein n=1 Tax=Coccomyxa viridis TaxID=1274662 RepID=A0AAV1HVZ9_9CHLO|nr:hypothetical protein CVIRNUC_002541 [Coccomyxa viridis]
MVSASDEAIHNALQRLLKRKGYVIMDKAGVPIQTSFEVGLVPPLVYLADDMVRDVDPQDELQFLRVRSAKQELMVSAHPEYTLLVVQSTGAQIAAK